LIKYPKNKETPLLITTKAKEFRMQKRIWSQYNKSLVQRGSVTFFIDKKTLDSIQNFQAKSTGGRPQEFPLLLIQFLVMLKVQFSLPYRALEGFARSIFEITKRWFRIPTYSLVCKKAKELALSLPKLSSRRPKVVLIDSSGIKVMGEGEWKRKIHGIGRPRKWLKVHIAVDENSQEIVSEILSECWVADSAMVDTLLEATGNSVKTVKADGAYDRKCVRNTTKKRGARLLTPPPRNARIHGIYPDRDTAISIIGGLGGDKVARSLWGKLTGYSYRVLAETAFSRLKRLFGPRLFSRTFDRQRVENRLKCLMLNEMRKAV
jgi:hypothetical protein